MRPARARTYKITHTTGIVNRTLARLHGMRWHEPCGCSANVLTISLYTPLLYYMCGVRVQHTRARNKPWTYMGAALSECFGKALHALPRCLPRTSVDACTTGNSGGKLANCTHTHIHTYTHTHAHTPRWLWAGNGAKHTTHHDLKKSPPEGGNQELQGLLKSWLITQQNAPRFKVPALPGLTPQGASCCGCFVRGVRRSLFLPRGESTLQQVARRQRAHA